MKTNTKSKLGYIAVLALILSFTACGNSNRKKVERDRQSQDSAIIIEEESVIVTVDSIAPDTILRR